MRACVAKRANAQRPQTKLNFCPDSVMKRATRRDESMMTTRQVLAYASALLKFLFFLCSRCGLKYAKTAMRFATYPAMTNDEREGIGCIFAADTQFCFNSTEGLRFKS